MKPYEIDDIIPFVKREEHIGNTIRQIIRYDSGYLKDLFFKDKRVVFSRACMDELKHLTKGHFDNWKMPYCSSNNIFSNQKKYKSPYLYDFNDTLIEKENVKRLLSQIIE